MMDVVIDGKKVRIFSNGMVNMSHYVDFDPAELGIKGLELEGSAMVVKATTITGQLSWLDAQGKPVVATATFVVPADSPRGQLRGSTDVGDVSWVVPTVQAYGATCAIGTFIAAAIATSPSPLLAAGAVTSR